MRQSVRKSITTLGFVLLTGCFGTALAQSPATGSTSGSGLMQLKPDAPDRYVVVPGDTLWSISERYTDAPTRWPELWGLNRDEVRNPHRIYPGNVIVLDRSRGTLTVMETQKLSPRVRSDASQQAAVPAIPGNVIEPFLARPLVIEEDGLDQAPRIIAAQDNRVILGAGNRAVVSGLGGNKEQVWHVYQRGKPLVDPDTQRRLGFEAMFLGTARFVSGGEPATVEIITAVKEISKGDRLIAAGAPQPVTYLPRAPRAGLEGRIISVYGSIDRVGEAGAQSVLALNRGKADGLEPGHVLAIFRVGGEAIVERPARDAPAKTVRLPEERYGLVYVFRVFERVSYALVMRVTKPVNAQDILRAP